MSLVKNNNLFQARPVNIVTAQTPTNESATSSGRRKLMWIIFSTMGVILITLGVTMPTILLTKKKELIDTPLNVTLTTKWKQYGITIAGGYEDGELAYHVPKPAGIYIDDDDQSIYIAEWGNNRVGQWKFNSEDGEILAGGNGQGNRTNQLQWPTDVVVNKSNDSIIICDLQNKRIVRWPRRNGRQGHILIRNIPCEGLTMDNNGDLYYGNAGTNTVRRWREGSLTTVAGGNGKGNNSNQLAWPNYIFVDQNYTVYVSEYHNYRVTKWLQDAKEGIIVAGGYGKGNNLTQLSHPRGIIVDHLESVYVADSDNNRIMRWLKGSTVGSVVIGNNGEGNQPNQLNEPRDISFDDKYNIYVADFQNNRIQKFPIDSN